MTILFFFFNTKKNKKQTILKTKKNLNDQTDNQIKNYDNKRENIRTYKFIFIYSALFDLILFDEY